MEVLIIGSGRVGSTLAKELIDLGIEVIILDSKKENLDKVEKLDCSKVLGMPLDTEVLEKAGVQSVSAVLTVSDNENLNVMVGQICQKIYGVKKVVVRIYNPENEASYQSLGLETICSTSMTMHKAMESLGLSIASDSTNIVGFPVEYQVREVTKDWAGFEVWEVEEKTKQHILAIIDANEMKLVKRSYVFQEGDFVVLVSLVKEDKE